VKIPFIGPSSQVRSLNADAQRSVNCFLELDQSSKRAPVALYGTPGTVLRAELAGGEHRGALRMGDYTYVVVGSNVYRLSTDYTAVLLGMIGTVTGRVELAQNGTECLIVDGVSGWLATTGALTQITDADFPNGVSSCCYIAGYFVVCGDSTGKLYINETPNQGTDWNGLDFATAEGSPDYTLACRAVGKELWLLGAESVEVWVPVTDPDFSFAPAGNTFLQQGTAAGATAQVMDNALFWLGANVNGQGIVFRAEGYTPQRISTHAIETAIGGYATVSDAFAWCYEIEGHSFYVLTFPTEDHTWVYDAASGTWHEWLWRHPSTGQLHRNRAAWHVFAGGEHLIGDYANGNVYALDLYTYTDNGDPIKRLRITPTFADTNDYRLYFFEQLIVDMARGVGIATGQGEDPEVMLRWFDFDAEVKQWSDPITAKIGAAGRGGRVMFGGPLGASRDRIWELSMTDPVQWAVFGAMAKAVRGAD
jgi:hypothetical protein